MGFSVSKIRHYIHVLDYLPSSGHESILTDSINYNYWNWYFHGSFVFFHSDPYYLQYLMLGKRECSMLKSIYIPGTLR